MQLGSSSKGNYGSGFQMGSFEVKSEINVTPLVDVCLVLLIIFMVVTPLLADGRRRAAAVDRRSRRRCPRARSRCTIAIKANGDDLPRARTGFRPRSSAGR